MNDLLATIIPLIVQPALGLSASRRRVIDVAMRGLDYGWYTCRKRVVWDRLGNDCIRRDG
jgi:hypothetical protein